MYVPVCGQALTWFLEKAFVCEDNIGMCVSSHKLLITRASVRGQLSETFQLPQPMFIAQSSSLHHSITCHLVSLETEFQLHDTFRCKMIAKILEHVIGELLDSLALPFNVPCNNKVQV